MNTIDIVEKIVKMNPDIELLTFTKYPEQIPIQKKINLSEIDEEFIANALVIRDLYKFPFWDCLMVSLFDKENVSDRILSSALLHNKNKEIIKTRDVQDIVTVFQRDPKINLSLNSEILFSNSKFKHLCLLDFHIFPSENNLQIATKVIRALKLSGHILDSGESYHFISDTFYDLDSILNILAMSLLFSPIIDRAWVAHQILERSCSIRVGMKHSKFPIVVKKVD